MSSLQVVPTHVVFGPRVLVCRLSVPLLAALPVFSAGAAPAQSTPPAGWSYAAVTPTTPVWVQSSPGVVDASRTEPAVRIPTSSWEPVPVTDQTSPRPPEESKGIIGIGGGARIGVGEPTYALLFGRLGVQLATDVAISLRPVYVFGNSDQFGKSNSQGSFQMPLTIDLAPRSPVSPYLGFGVATNTDSNGGVDPMLSGGVDIKLVERLYLTVGLNYIFQSGDQDNRDLEALSALYFKF